MVDCLKNVLQNILGLHNRMLKDGVIRLQIIRGMRQILLRVWLFGSLWLRLLKGDTFLVGGID